jgi:hypothetical protein
MGSERFVARSSLADRITPYGRGAHHAPESLAESVRRMRDRLDPKRVPGPLRDPERETSKAGPGLYISLTTTRQGRIGGSAWVVRQP